MKKSLISIVLFLSIISGCNEPCYKVSPSRLVEVAQNFQNGVSSYYTQEEKNHQKAEFGAAMNNTHNLADKYRD